MLLQFEHTFFKGATFPGWLKDFQNLMSIFENGFPDMLFNTRLHFNVPTLVPGFGHLNLNIGNY